MRADPLIARLAEVGKQLRLLEGEMTLNLTWQFGGEVTHELRHHRVFRVRNVAPVASDGLHQSLQQGDDGGMLLVQLLADAVIEIHNSTVQLLVFGEQLLFRFVPVRVGLDAVRRTDQLALRLILGADALSAFQRIDHVHWIAGGDRLVRAHRLASIASRAGFVDYQSHNFVSLRSHAALGTRPVAASLSNRNAPHNAAPIAPANIESGWLRIATFMSLMCEISSSSAATSPLSRASPPVTITAPSTTPIDFNSLDSRAAIERWMPFRIFGVVMPRETMLITSVSASTAQMLLTTSGLSPWLDNEPISSCAIPR